jgi:hypothetical protein
VPLRDEAVSEPCQRNLENEGGVIVGHLLEFAENDDLFHLERQSIYTLADEFYSLPASQQKIGIIGHGGGLFGPIIWVERHKALAIPELLPDEMAGDGTEPGRKKGAARIELVGLPKHGQENLLRHFLSDGNVSTRTERIPIDERTMPVIEGGHGIPVTPGDGAKQVRIGRGDLREQRMRPGACFFKGAGTRRELRQTGSFMELQIRRKSPNLLCR